MALMLCPVGKSAGSAAPITRQPDVAGGHCNTLQCSVVTAVLAFVAERGASSVSVWVDSCDRLSRRSCSSFAPGEPSPMQTFAEWVGGLSWGGVPLKNMSVSRENEVPRGIRQCGLRNQLSLRRSHCCHEQWESVSDCADGSHAVSGWKVYRLCSSQHASARCCRRAL